MYETSFMGSPFDGAVPAVNAEQVTAVQRRCHLLTTYNGAASAALSWAVGLAGRRSSSSVGDDHQRRERLPRCPNRDLFGPASGTRATGTAKLAESGYDQYQNLYWARQTLAGKQLVVRLAD